MRMSISTTSGLSWRDMLHRLGPVGRLADHVEVVLGVEDHLEPGAHERLVVGDQDAHHAHARAPAVSAASSSPSSGSRTETSNPPPAPAARVQLPAVHPHALAHADQPVAAAGQARVDAAVAAIGDEHLHRVGTVVHADLGRRAAAVLDHVRERLLEHAVGREVEPGGELRTAAVHLER